MIRWVNRASYLTSQVHSRDMVAFINDVNSKSQNPMIDISVVELWETASGLSWPELMAAAGNSIDLFNFDNQTRIELENGIDTGSDWKVSLKFKSNNLASNGDALIGSGSINADDGIFIFGGNDLSIRHNGNRHSLATGIVEDTVYDLEINVVSNSISGTLNGVALSTGTITDFGTIKNIGARRLNDPGFFWDGNIWDINLNDEYTFSGVGTDWVDEGWYADKDYSLSDTTVEGNSSTSSGSFLIAS